MLSSELEKITEARTPSGDHLPVFLVVALQQSQCLSEVMLTILCSFFWRTME